jgi:glycine hydroxymethyltransferase
MEEAEDIAVSLAKQVFNASEVELHVPSGKLACEAVAIALTKADDLVLELYPIATELRNNGLLPHGVRVDYLPYDKAEMNIDTEAALKLIRNEQPKLIRLGDTDILFPHPVQEIAEAAEGVGATVVYDASHVYALIAGHSFQDPFSEGASIIEGSTHKTLPGPQGGLILMKDADDLSTRVIRTLHSLIGNHHPSRKAVLAIVFAEMLAFGKEYARNIVRNARALGTALYERGFDVLCPDKGFTRSHQILLSNEIANSVPGRGGARETGRLLEEANVVADVSVIPNREWHTRGPPVLRFGSSEITRLGMGPSEMQEIAAICENLILKRKKPAAVAEEVADLMRGYQTLHFCFDEGDEAYQYFQLSSIAG